MYKRDNNRWYFDVYSEGKKLCVVVTQKIKIEKAMDLCAEHVVKNYGKIEFSILLARRI
jgi:hypothetical protein